MNENDKELLKKIRDVLVEIKDLIQSLKITNNNFIQESCLNEILKECNKEGIKQHIRRNVFINQ